MRPLRNPSATHRRDGILSRGVGYPSFGTKLTGHGRTKTPSKKTKRNLLFTSTDKQIWRSREKETEGGKGEQGTPSAPWQRWQQANDTPNDGGGGTLKDHQLTIQVCMCIRPEQQRPNLHTTETASHDHTCACQCHAGKFALYSSVNQCLGTLHMNLM